MKCDFNPKSFSMKVAAQLLSLKNSTAPANEIKQEILKAIIPVAEAMGIDTNYHLQDALILLKGKILKPKTDKYKLGWNPEVIPSTNELKSALLNWKKEIPVVKEDTTTKKLNKFVESFREDPLDVAFGRSFYAKQRCQQQANKVGVNSILYNSTDGIISTENYTNFAIETQQELLLQTILNYLKENNIDISQLPDNVYDRIGKYTGVIENPIIVSFFSSFSEDKLTKAYNEQNYKLLDAYNAYVILNNFDTILTNVFGKY